jgi:hypothetical protein
VSFSFYMDAHVRSAITEGLRRRGVDVLTAQEDGADGLPDEELLDRATSLGRLVFTNDQDFLIEARRRQDAGEDFSSVVYTHQKWGNLGQCIDDLEIIAKAGLPEDALNQVIYLPL